MKQEGNSHAEKPENTSIWKEVENRRDLGEHAMIFSYLKDYPWEERSKWIFVLLQIAGLGHWVKLQDTYFKKKKFIFVSKQKEQEKSSDVSLKVLKYLPKDPLLLMYYEKYTSARSRVDKNNFSRSFLLRVLA